MGRFPASATLSMEGNSPWAVVFFKSDKLSLLDSSLVQFTVSSLENSLFALLACLWVGQLSWPLMAKQKEPTIADDPGRAGGMQKPDQAFFL